MATINMMTHDERKELETLITEFIESAVSDEYATQILNSEFKGHTLMDDIVSNVIDTSAWKTDHHYNDSDIRYAIGRELIHRMDNILYDINAS